MNQSCQVRHAARGLTGAEVEASRREHGHNRLTEVPRKSFLRHFLGNLNDPVIRILLCALGVNLFFVFRGGDPFETVGIGISVFLATLISTLSERGSEAAFRRLGEEADEHRVRVFRDGALHTCPMDELVVGDRILLGAGEQVPADGHLISGTLRVDQSAMTGENREITKRPERRTTKAPTPADAGAVFRGCPILGGEAEVEIFAVGDATFLGGISQEIQTETRESPLRIRLTKLARQISVFGYVAAFLIGAAYLFNTLVLDSGWQAELILWKLRDLPYLGSHLLRAFMLGLTVVVMSVPEGLPMMVAVVLSANIRRMIRDRVLVRKPVGIEAAGSMDLLFTDKTGTLTEGVMSVHRILVADGKECSSSGELRRLCPALYERYLLSCLCNTSAKWAGETAVGGNATDRALLRSVLGAELRQKASVDKSLPFDSDRKYSAVRLKAPRHTVLIKGAPERLWRVLDYAYTSDGRCVPFRTVAYDLHRRMEELTSGGERVLLLAEGEEWPGGGVPGGLTLLAAVCLKDRLRPEARPSVQRLTEAGVQVVMITGDHPGTAQAIAKDCGILNRERRLILTSEELSALSDEEVKERLPRLAVVARALPSDKSRLVRLAQEEERVVGMTGDGINDAPALKRADIGFAMGSGTSVAKDAGDIIILDNNLSSITKAVMYGRTIFKSIRKFITLQLTMNLCAVGVCMIGPFVGYDAPVTVTQMLWINLIMDTLGGLAFAGEAPTPHCMTEKPKRRNEPILNGYMLHQIVWSGLFTVGLCLAFLLYPAIGAHFRASADRLCLLTAFFALFIFTSVLHCFHARSDRLNLFAGIGRNRLFLWIMGAVSAVQLLFVYLGGHVLRTMPLTVEELGYTLLLSLTVLPSEFLRKLLWRAGGHKTGF